MKKFLLSVCMILVVVFFANSTLADTPKIRWDFGKKNTEKSEKPPVVDPVKTPEAVTKIKGNVVCLDDSCKLMVVCTDELCVLIEDGTAEPLPLQYKPTAEYCLSDAAFKEAKKDRNAAVFQLGSPNPTKEGEAFIRKNLNEIPSGGVLDIYGYTDSVPHSGDPFGSKADLEFQLWLSQERAKSVAKIARSMGFGTRIVKGLGRAENPAVPYDPQHKGEAENRRVLIKVADLPSCSPREVRVRFSLSNGWAKPVPNGTAIRFQVAPNHSLVGTTGTHYRPGGEDTIVLDPWPVESYVDFPTVREYVEITGWKFPDADWVMVKDLLASGVITERLFVCSRPPEGKGTNLVSLLPENPRVIISDGDCAPCEDCP